jgi:hypothetical protein
MKIFASSICFILFFSCAKEDKYKFKDLPDGPVNHHLITVARKQNDVIAKAFSGAVPVGSKVFFELGSKNQKQNVASNGSFEVTLNNVDANAEYAQLTFTINNKYYQYSYTIKNISNASAQLAHKAFSTSVDIDDIKPIANKILVLSSQSSFLRQFSLSDEWVINTESVDNLLLNPSLKSNLWPRSIDAQSSHALVPFFGANELALINSNNMSLTKTSRLMDKEGKLFLFDNNPPLTVNKALSADGTSSPSTTIKSSFAHSPERVLAIGNDRYLATFVNYYQFEDKIRNSHAVVGPGIVALLTVKDNTLVTLDIKVLKCKNPQYIIKKNDRDFFVTCTGVWKDLSKDNLTTSDAALVNIKLGNDNNSFSQIQELPLTSFVPAEPALVRDKIVIPEAFKNRVMVLSQDAQSFSENDIVSLKFHRPFAFTCAALWHDSIVFLGSQEGSLLAFDAESKSFFPFPFLDPIPVGAVLVQKLIFRNQNENYDLATSYKKGFSAFALTSALQSKIIPLDLLEFFGP